MSEDNDKPQNRIKDLYARGVDAFDRGDYQEAEHLLSDLISINPRFADVFNKLGFMASLRGDLYRAIEFFQRAVHINPQYTEASLNLSVTLNEVGDTDKAYDEMQRLSHATKVKEGDLDPFVAGKLANEHLRLGNLYLDLGRHDDAIAEFRKALKLRAGLADILTKLCIALRETGDFDAALVEINKALKSNSHYGPAWVQAGLTYYMKGDHQRAIRVWEEALKMIPDLKEARSFLKIFRDEA